MKQINAMKQLYACALLLCLLTIAGMFVSQSAWAANSARPISISVKNAEIADLFQMLSTQYHVNILLSKGVEGQVSVNLYNVTVPDAISSIAAAAGYIVEKTNHGYIVTLPAEAGKTVAGGLKQIRTFKIQYSDPKKVADIVRNYVSRFGRVDVLTERNIIVVEDMPEFVRQAEQLIESLDRQPAQILIEAHILDITLDDQQSLGIEWRKPFNGDSGSDFGFQDLALAAAPGGFFFTLLDKNIEVQINALSKQGKVRVLATPKLLALENQDAEVVIGDRLGYKTLLRVDGSNASLENIQFLESGVILKVTPYVDRKGSIMMKIHPEVSTGTLSRDGIPNQKTSEVTTEVLVEDGQTIFIGGLLKNNMSSGESGIPFLEDIPLLGLLFSTTNQFSENLETIVMLRPQIIRPQNLSLITEPKEKTEKFQQDSEIKIKEVEDFFEQRTKLWGKSN